MSNYDYNATERLTNGTINFDDESSNIAKSVRETYMGSTEFGKKIGTCRVFVYNNEGPIPHFHIENNNGFKCCVMLFDNRYFSHGSKTDTLSNKQCKLLDEWLSSKSILPFFNNITNWETLVAYWVSEQNPMKLIPKNPIKPDYTTFKPYK